MNRNLPNKNIVVYTFLFFAAIVAKPGMASAQTGSLKMTFINTVNGRPVVLRDSIYSNYFGEQYSISKLKYYISNIIFSSNAENKNMGGYYLVNTASDNNSFDIQLKPGTYNSIGFLLGVDSIRNCSGAQTDALDPMNDMFWTWNTGYVMFKLEGTSASSTADLNRIEHHIGGYKGSNNVATKIDLSFAAGHLLEVKANSITEIVIEMNIDNYWHGTNDIKIAETPVCMITGELAKKIAANFQGLFSIKSIRNIP